MADVKKACMTSMATLPLGTTPKDQQSGTDFCKYLFTHHKDLRKYFKGAENFTGDDVQKSDRLQKIGLALITTVHVFVNIYDNEMVFRAFCRNLTDRHLGRGVDPSLWKAFWDIWVAFLDSRGTVLSAEQKTAWNKLGTRFNEECQQYLAKQGLPNTLSHP
uniref:GLOBIN domain-containing protein n=1 Tax=Haemonchus contortus TaxID=6289 RepID=A0A7I4YQQ9_HAECO|nr:Globin domain containing protein [Haemonchus contortus]